MSDDPDSKEKRIPRRKAESMPAERRTAGNGTPSTKSARLSHELSTYKIELEMQNDELRQAYAEIEASHTRYRDLYENAPVGYLALDEKGLVSEANLTVARLLATKKNRIVGRPFASFVAPESQDIFHFHTRTVSQAGTRHACELILKRKDRGLFNAEMESVGTRVGDAFVIRSALTDITERKRTEEALQRSRELELLTAISGESPDPIWVKDLESRIIFGNAALLRVWGKTMEEVIGRTDRELYDDPAIGDQIMANDRLVIKSGTSQVLEEVAQTPNGLRTFLTTKTPYRDKGNNVVGTIGIARDITDRKVIEQALHTAEERYRAIFSEMAYGAALHQIITDSEGSAVDYVTIDVNGAFESLLDCTREAVIGRRASDVLPSEELKHWLGIFGQVALTGESRRYTMYSPINDKYFDGTAYSPEKGQFAVVFSDVTDSRRAEEALRKSEEKFRSYIESAPLAVFIADKDGHIIDVNRAATRLLGHDTAAFLRMHFWELHSAADRENGLRGFETLNRDGRLQAEFQLQRNDGSVVSVLLHATMIGGGLSLTYCLDITEKKRLEEQLRQVQKMEAIGTLAGGVAHDFNNILTVILGLGNLLQMDMDEGDIHKAYVDQIVASSERAADLTRSLLAFSRKQRIILELHTVDGAVTVGVKLLTRLLPEDIGLSVNLSGEDTSSLLDVTQIGQILMNLATNARDAMPRGGSLTITTGRAKIDESFVKAHGFGLVGDYVKLSVSDTGIGMDKKTMERIFEPFFTTKEVGKGTGLGLASTFGIVKQHDGYITVSSVPSVGTTFDIYLPVAQVSPGKETPKSGGITGGSETVLIVEDDPDVRNMLTKILTGYGYTTIEAADGNNAIRIHRERKERIDLTILDVVMPGKNGKEAYDEIVRANPHAKVIFMSGYTGHIVIDKGIESNSVDLIEKPLSVTGLLAKVREVLDR
jgi:PAS domain S-box-containing protein